MIKKAVKASARECPICEYQINNCQCMFGGSAHPNRDVRRRVVFDHLYLFNSIQQEHLISLQERMRISYAEKEPSKILNSLINEYLDKE